MVRCSDAMNGYLADLRTDGGINVWRQTDGAFALLRQGRRRRGLRRRRRPRSSSVAVRGHGHRPVARRRGAAPVSDPAFAAGTVGVRATATPALVVGTA